MSDLRTDPPLMDASSAWTSPPEVDDSWGVECAWWPAVESSADSASGAEARSGA